jgi:hypothetical protein
MFDIKVKETSLPLSDLLTEKIRVGSSQRTLTTDPGSLTSGSSGSSVQVDLVEVEVPGPQTSGPPTSDT